jgi:hypothetical protein
MIAINVSLDIRVLPSTQKNLPWFWQISGKRLAALHGADTNNKVEAHTIRKSFIGQTSFSARRHRHTLPVRLS